MSELERALAASPSAGVNGWARVVSVSLEQLRVAFERHVANAEGTGGLFEELIEHAPRLVHRVNRLRDDHATLTTELTALAQRLDGPIVDDTIAAVRDMGSELLAHLGHHRFVGSDLVYEAYNVDIDAAD